MIEALRQIQVPLLAALLLGGCGTKAWRVLRTRTMDGGLGPTVLFPVRLRRPVAIGICATELALGVGLILTATRVGAGVPATVIRTGVAMLFLTAAGALVELRERRPGMGCGCFGELSVTPVGGRTIARSVLLAAAATATIGAPALTVPRPASAAVVRIAVLVAELVVLGALSPELAEVLIRLGYSEPCELRTIPAERTLAALRRSALWRRHAAVLTSTAPTDLWREGCWRYVVYPGRQFRREVEVVFAVSLRSRRPRIRAAVLDAVTDEVLHGLDAPERLDRTPVMAGTGVIGSAGRAAAADQPHPGTRRPAALPTRPVSLPHRPARAADHPVPAGARVAAPVRCASTLPARPATAPGRPVARDTVLPSARELLD